MNSDLVRLTKLSLEHDLNESEIIKKCIFLNIPSDSIVTMAHPVSLKIPPKKKYSSFKNKIAAEGGFFAITNCYHCRVNIWCRLSNTINYWAKFFLGCDAIWIGNSNL